jgi:hypothetical protein
MKRKAINPSLLKSTLKLFSTKQKMMMHFDISQTKFFDEELFFVNENDEFVKPISKLDGKAYLKNSSFKRKE